MLLEGRNQSHLLHLLIIYSILPHYLGFEPTKYMKHKDLRDFINQLEKMGDLKRIQHEVDPCLEITEICDRTLKNEGPALLFENVKGSKIPVLGNLFGTAKRVAMGMGEDNVDALREVCLLYTSDAADEVSPV